MNVELFLQLGIVVGASVFLRQTIDPLIKLKRKSRREER